MTRESPSSRNQSKMIASLLNDALAKGDTVAFVKAIGDLIRAQGMTEVSQNSGLQRPTLYRSFGGNRMPNFDRVIRTLAALELEYLVMDDFGRCIAKAGYCSNLEHISPPIEYL